MRAYLDSCVLIHLVEQSPRQGAMIKAALKRHGARMQICWTALTRLECRTRPLRENNRILLARFDAFFTQADAVFFDLATNIYEFATELRARHRLKTPDALHLAAAIEGGCDEFWTNDTRLDAAASAHLRTVIF
ncbi:MAG: PIN domain-containing protein [Zoogloeaceae bacterium]|jgi:predicted nucleic acid-binding protein|nr:PIN domain-containing protein [Zoogloeaceae bacterium]